MYYKENAGYVCSREYRRIKNLYDKKKFEFVIKEAKEYLKHENSIYVRFMLAKSLRYLGLFDEAIITLEENIEYEKSLGLLSKSYSINELFFLYYFVGNYEEAFKIINNVNRGEFLTANNIRFIKLVLCKKLNIDVSVDAKNCDYMSKQIINYNEEAAILRIKQHAHCLHTEPTKSYFNENINIDYLYDVIKKSLKTSKRLNMTEIMDIYYFSLNNSGYHGDCICDKIKVVVIPGTEQIITMHPSNDIIFNIYESVNDLTLDYDKLYSNKQNKPKTRVLTQTEKFNKRYKKV